MFKYHCLNPISAVGMNKLDQLFPVRSNFPLQFHQTRFFIAGA